MVAPLICSDICSSAAWHRALTPEIQTVQMKICGVNVSRPSFSDAPLNRPQSLTSLCSIVAFAVRLSLVGSVQPFCDSFLMLPAAISVIGACKKRDYNSLFLQFESSFYHYQWLSHRSRDNIYREHCSLLPAIKQIPDLTKQG